MAAGKDISIVPIPPEIQRDLPAGTLVYSFDGELVYRGKDSSLQFEPRDFSLIPIVENPLMYERRWPGGSAQDTYLSIEHFHGHAVTMFYFFLVKEDTAKTGMYRAVAFAAMSRSTYQWLWVTNPYAVGVVVRGPLPSGGKTVLKFMLNSNRQKVLDENDRYAATIDRLVTHLRFEMHQKLQNTMSPGRL